MPVIEEINVYSKGWIGFFGICTEQIESTLQTLDAHIRRRLRAMELKQCKRKRTIVKKLIQYGVKARTAWSSVYGGHKSIWALSHTAAVDRALKNSLWDARGLNRLSKQYLEHCAHKAAQTPKQSALVFG